MNIKFPETNLVECVFSLKQNRVASDTEYDEKDYAQNKKFKKYTYRVPEYLKGQVHTGDFVVVHCQTGYQICEVVSINAFAPGKEESYAPVVAFVDLSLYWREKEKQKKLDALKQQLIEEKARLEKMITFEMIADKNPEFKQLLEAFKAAGGQF